jgi:hypothetical protein
MLAVASNSIYLQKQTSLHGVTPQTRDKLMMHRVTLQTKHTLILAIHSNLVTFKCYEFKLAHRCLIYISQTGVGL